MMAFVRQGSSGQDPELPQAKYLSGQDPELPQAKYLTGQDPELPQAKYLTGQDPELPQAKYLTGQDPELPQAKYLTGQDPELPQAKYLTGQDPELPQAKYLIGQDPELPQAKYLTGQDPELPQAKYLTGQDPELPQAKYLTGQDPELPQAKYLTGDAGGERRHKEEDNCIKEEPSISSTLSSIAPHAASSSSASSTSSSSILPTPSPGDEKQICTKLLPPSTDDNEGSDGSSDSGHFSTSPYNEGIQIAQDEKSTTKRHCFSIDFLLSHNSIERRKQSPVQETTDCDSQQSTSATQEEDVHDRIQLNVPAQNPVSVDKDESKDNMTVRGSYETTAKYISGPFVSSTWESAGDGTGSIYNEEIVQQPNENMVLSATADDSISCHFDESDVSNVDEKDSSLASLTESLSASTQETISPDQTNQRENQTQKEPGCVTPNNGKHVKRKLKRTQYSKEDLLKLNSKFKRHPWLSPEKQEKLAEEMGYTDTQIKTWFQNKRASIFGSRKPKKRALQEIQINALSQSHFTSASPFGHSPNIRNDANKIPRTSTDAQNQLTLMGDQLAEGMSNAHPELPLSSTDLGQLYAQNNPLGFTGAFNCHLHNNTMPGAQAAHPFLSQIPWTNSPLYPNLMTVASESQQQAAASSSTTNSQTQDSLRPNRHPDAEPNNCGYSGVPLPFLPYSFLASNFNVFQTNASPLYLNSQQANDPYFLAAGFPHLVGAGYSFTAQNGVSTAINSSVPNRPMTGLTLPNGPVIHRPWLEGHPFAHGSRPPFQPMKTVPVEAYKNALPMQTNSISAPVFHDSSSHHGDRSCVSSPVDLSKRDSVNDPYSVHFSEYMEHFSRQLHKRDDALKDKGQSQENRYDNNDSPANHVTSTCESGNDTEDVEVEVD